MILLAIVALIAAEVAALVAVAERIGVFEAVGLLILVSLSGPWLVRRAGFGVWRRAQDRLNRGAAPDREVLDGVLLLIAGLLICIPGFVTDAVGIALLLPPVRALVRRRVSRRAANSVLFRFGGPDGPAGRWLGDRGGGGRGGGGRGGRGRDGGVVDADSHLPPPGSPGSEPFEEPPPLGPGADRPGPASP